MKKLIAVLLALALTLSAALCLAEEQVTIRLGGLKGPTSMGMVKLLEDNENGETELKYEFTMGGVQMIAVNTLGLLYVVEKGGESIQTIEDLAGKTIYTTGKGSTPEYVLNYLLAQHGMTMGTDVQVEWKSEPTEVVAQMATEEQAVAMLPQPFVTVASTQLEGLRVALDMTAEWDALNNGSQLVTAGLIIRKAFADEHPDAVAKFLEEYAASTAFANEHVEEAAQLIEKYDIVKAAVAQKALPFCNIVCVTGQEMVDMTTGYFQVLFDQEPASLGGAMPGADFFWTHE